MSEIYSRQKMQDEMQNNKSFIDAFSKLVSGKAGYKAAIESKNIIIKCKNCNTILEQNQKFCHECGTRAEK
mgnify:CR=1 FL=1